MVEIVQRGDPIDEADVAAFEREAAVKLPEAYRKFLLSTDGGRPRPDVIDIPDLPGHCADVQIFFGIRRRFETSNLSWNLQLIEDRHPARHILPFACDSFGGLFCFRLTREKRHQVIFCDMTDPDGTMYDVAPDFETFMAKLRPWEADT